MGIKLLVVGGGGGGGSSSTSLGGGGGGGGGFRYISNHSVTETTYTVTVGTGGGSNQNGNGSSFGSISVDGGGAGGAINDAGSNGGCGGGSGCDGSGPGPSAGSSTGYGYGGGIGVDGHGGGGGGAAGAGGNAKTPADGGGLNGAGAACDITGSIVYYAAGGSGGYGSNYTSVGGGGIGSYQATSSGHSATGIGSGGGGAYHTYDGQQGGAGATGTVIVAYLTKVYNCSYTGSNVETFVSGDYTVVKFNASGSFIVNSYARWQTPISRWSLDGNANDAYGLYNGTASNVTYSTSDKAFGSGSGSFNGSSSYINLGNYAGLVPAEITISAWVKLTATGGCMIYDKDGDGSNRGFYVQILNGYIDITCGGNLPITRSGRTNLVNDGNWHHIVACGSGSIAWKTYIDGKLDMTGSSMAPVYTNTVNGSIGKGSYPGIPQYFNGNLDDVRFYDVALTADEVMNLYKSYATPIWQQPLHRWKLDGDATDSAGNKNGTAVGTVEYSRSSKIIGNYAMICDGGVDYINTGNWKWQDYTNYSISVWFRYSASDGGTIFTQCKSGSNLNRTGIVVQSTGQIAYYFVNGSSALFSDSSTDTIYKDNKWHHVCIIDANGTVTCYIDSKLDTGLSGSYTRESLSSDNVLIGYSNIASPNVWTGGIDDVRFYDVALSAADVKALYNSYFTEKATNFMSML